MAAEQRTSTQSDEADPSPHARLANAAAETQGHQQLALEKTARQLGTPSPTVRFGRSTALALVMGVMLLAAPLGYFLLDLQPGNGQLAAAVLATGMVALLVVQFIRYRQRVSLRTLLLALAVIAACLAFLGRDILDARREARAIESLKRLGARTDDGSPYSPRTDFVDTDDGSLIPSWVRDALGKNFFYQLKELRLADSFVSDADLVKLADFRSLQSLDVRESKITPAGLHHLPRVRGLKYVSLNWSQVTDESLAGLAGHSELVTLYISFTPVDIAILSGGGAIIRAPSPEMPEVDLWSTAPTSNLTPLAQLTQAETLLLEVSKFSAADGAALATLPKLRVLTLNGQRIQGEFTQLEGFAPLAQARTLRNLQIAIPTFGDAQLRDLIGIQGLEQVSLLGTAVTADGVAAFRQEHPTVQVTTNPPVRNR